MPREYAKRRELPIINISYEYRQNIKANCEIMFEILPIAAILVAPDAFAECMRVGDRLRIAPKTVHTSFAKTKRK